MELRSPSPPPQKKKIFQIFEILILRGDIEQRKSSRQPNIASCLPSGKISQNILARLQLAVKGMFT